MDARAGVQTGCVTYALSNTKLWLASASRFGVLIHRLPYQAIESRRCWSVRMKSRFGLLGMAFLRGGLRTGVHTIASSDREIWPLYEHTAPTRHRRISIT